MHHRDPNRVGPGVWVSQRFSLILMTKVKIVYLDEHRDRMEPKCGPRRAPSLHSYCVDLIIDSTELGDPNRVPINCLAIAYGVIKNRAIGSEGLARLSFFRKSIK